jgi:sarcosine oxidase delta subunit
MRCPYCGADGTRRELHAHLADLHADRVETRSPRFGRRFYELTCPKCGESHRAEIKPRGTDPGFVDEYAREIRLVAFDMFLYHLQAAHEEETSV